MKFVALISGGKDSFYNILQCLNNGHTLHALANLHPSDASVSELDSFMFQTVGHDIIEHYRQCVGNGIPLYRRSIRGKSANISLEYEITSGDEIEDLYELLKEVKTLHPEIEGVSCGAILSHYQRTRVENVCDRLNLTSLTYLWQGDQSKLMLDMSSSGIEAILVKVAAIGLTDKHLGKSLTEMYPVLEKLNSLYDVHVCGEGGEFETLVLDAPFFVKRLRVVDQKVVKASSDVSHLLINVEVLDKTKIQTLSQSYQFPPLIQENFQELTIEASKIPDDDSTTDFPSSSSFPIQPQIVSMGTRIYIVNLSSRLSTVEEQAEDVLLQLKSTLEKHSFFLSQIQHMTVFVSDMEDFAKLNSVYEGFFKHLYLPPSRVCVETVLPSSCKLLVSCTASAFEKEKSGIHIRSRSYWAPQNIGPYSQAIVETNNCSKFATLSGQIPLIPRSMLIDNSLTTQEQIVLSLQHLYKVKALIKVGQIGMFVCYITNKVTPHLVAQIWKNYVSDIEDEQNFESRLLILKVKALPRHASVEWAGISHEKVVDMYTEEDSEDELSNLNSPSNISRPLEVMQVSLGALTLQKFVGNDFDKLVEFLRDPLLQNSLVNVSTDLDSIRRLSGLGLTAEWTPVIDVFDSDGSKYGYGVIWIN